MLIVNSSQVIVKFILGNLKMAVGNVRGIKHEEWVISGGFDVEDFFRPIPEDVLDVVSPRS